MENTSKWKRKDRDRPSGMPQETTPRITINVIGFSPTRLKLTIA
ncbi:hypothetical protein [uncultured Robinsoniella sp.]